jgi:hypothetical protein
MDQKEKENLIRVLPPHDRDAFAVQENNTTVV